MTRILVTQVFPFLLPIRKYQKKKFFYRKMNKDQNVYANQFNESLYNNMLYEDISLLINENSGADIKYQYNKVHNLKITAQTMDKLIIKPNETFSFWMLAKNHKNYGEFKPGLNLVRGRLSEVEGGGLCQLSNMLYNLFLHSPLDIVERVGHDSISIAPTNTAVLGIDATLNEGWIDLKVKNNTDYSFQLNIFFDEEYMYGRIYCDKDIQIQYCLYNSYSKIVRLGNSLYHNYILNRKLYHKSILIKDEQIYNETKKIDYDYTYINKELLGDVRYG